MIIKNISGESAYFGFGTKARGRTIANNATATLPEEPTVLAEVQRYVGLGLLQIVSGPAASSILGGGTTPASGYILVTGAVADNDFVTIAGEKFKFANDPGTGVLGTYYTSLTARWAGDGAAAATAVGTLKTAINNVTALNVTAGTAVQYASGDYMIPLKAKDGTMDGTDLTLVKSGTELAVSDDALADGSNQAGRRIVIITHTVTAGEDTLKAIAVETGLPSISWYQIQLRDATGLEKAWDGLAVVSGGAFILTGAGSVDPAETDIFYILAAE